MVYEYEYDEESQKMRINALGGLYGDSIEDYSACKIGRASCRERV